MGLASSATTISVPPLDGTIPVLPGFVDFHARHNPDGPWVFLAADSPGTSSTFISFHEYADATHRIAHHIRPRRTGADGEVIAVLIHTDAVLYLAVISGIVRAGHVPFPISPKNTPQAIASMMTKTSCQRIWSQKAFEPVLDDVRKDLSQTMKLKVDYLPELHDIFPTIAGCKSHVTPYPVSLTPLNMNDIALYIHSSGSSGPPKPIPQRHINMLHWSRSSVILAAAKHDLVWGSMAAPTFHTIGICAQLLVPLVTGRPVALYSPRHPAPPVTPTPQNLLAACKAAGANAIPAVPTFLEAWAQSEDDRKYLASLKLVTSGGGPLSDQSARILVDADVKLASLYGGTEFGVHSIVFDIDYSTCAGSGTAKTKDDWAWMAFPESVRWDPQGDGSFELQFLTCDAYRPSVENLTDRKGYATNDLFVPHPTKKNLWRITGRKDDVIVLSTGEKVVPIPQEGYITSSPKVSGAVMFGRSQSQCGVLVEPFPEHAAQCESAEGLVKFKDEIWPIIQGANLAAPSFARIFKDMIIVTDPARPLPRAAKGTVIRKQALDLYAQEINNLYSSAPSSTDVKDGSIEPPLDWSMSSIELWLSRQVVSIHDGKTISSVIDIFDQGFDSLHATFLRNRIIGMLKSSPDDRAKTASLSVPYTIVYDNPTLVKLAAAVARLVDPDSASAEMDDVQTIADMIEKYSEDIPKPSYGAVTLKDGNASVLLTGSTGNLGSHILATILAEPGIEKVYTLNRFVPNSPDRQANALRDRGLPESLLGSGKLVELFGDLAQPGFGLDEEQWNEIKCTVTHVIHNAWRIDFNRALPSFDSYVAGTRHLVEVCAQSPRPIRLLFTSSVSSMQRWPSSKGLVPEEAGVDPKVAGTTGYAASKFVAENVLARAFEADIPCTTLRIGQICGSKTTGAWDPSEWVPILFKSSIALGALPDLVSDVSWIPMDTVANVVRDLVLSQEHFPSLMNLVHPRPIPWENIMNAFNATLPGETLPVIPFDKWLQRLERSAARARNEDLSSIPAISLIQVFRDLASPSTNDGFELENGGIPGYDTKNLCQYSPSVSGLESIGQEHVEAWLSWWRKKGFIQ